MARANLNISADVQDAFLLAQEEDSKVRGLKITISNEDLVLGGTIGRTGTAADDFNSVPGFLGEEITIRTFSFDFIRLCRCCVVKPTKLFFVSPSLYRKSSHHLSPSFALRNVSIILPSLECVLLSFQVKKKPVW